MRKRLFFGILWRFVAWSAATGCALGALLPPTLIVVGLVIWGFILSGQSVPAALFGTEFSSMVLMMIYSVPIGFSIGGCIGIPTGIISGLMVGLLSIGLFFPPSNKTFYRVVMTFCVLVIYIAGTILGIEVLIMNHYLVRELWVYPIIVPVSLVAIYACRQVTSWYLSTAGVTELTHPE